MSGVTAEQARRRARQVADEVLLPDAMNVDAADRVPAAHFDALARAWLYALAGPPEAGGLETGRPEADRAVLGSVIEIMASGCLATAFVWLQHHAAVRALAASANTALAGQWLEPLCRGAQRAGVALGGARPGPPLLQARPADGGYVLDGRAPWVTGWDMIDVLHTLARDQTGNVVAALLPAVACASLGARPLDLVAVNASRTVELSFTGHFVPAELVTGVQAHAQWRAADAAGLRPNGSLSLGVAARCVRMLGEAGPAGAGAARVLTAELDAARSALDAAGGDALPAARAAASELAFRAAGALAAVAGSRAVLAGQHPERLAREALFLLVFGSRPAIRQDLVGLLAGSGRAARPGS